MIWFKSEPDLKNFHNFLNDLHPDMKFTIESSEKQLPFLDVLIKKQGTIIETDLFSIQRIPNSILTSTHATQATPKEVFCTT